MEYHITLKLSMEIVIRKYFDMLDQKDRKL